MWFRLADGRVVLLVRDAYDRLNVYARLQGEKAAALWWIRCWRYDAIWRGQWQGTDQVGIVISVLTAIGTGQEREPAMSKDGAQ